MADILFDMFNTVLDPRYQNGFCKLTDNLKNKFTSTNSWHQVDLQELFRPRAIPSSPTRTLFNCTKDVFTLDIPGYSREEITVYLVGDDKIIITATNETRGERSLEVYPDSKFSTENTKITLKDGVLTLTFPEKKKPEPRTLKISD